MDRARDKLLTVAGPILPYLGDIAIGLAIAALIAAIVVFSGRPSQFVYIDF